MNSRKNCAMLPVCCNFRLWCSFTEASKLNELSNLDSKALYAKFWKRRQRWVERSEEEFFFLRILFALIWLIWQSQSLWPVFLFSWSDFGSQQREGNAELKRSEHRIQFPSKWRSDRNDEMLRVWMNKWGLWKRWANVFRDNFLKCIKKENSQIQLETNLMFPMMGMKGNRVMNQLLVRTLILFHRPSRDWTVFEGCGDGHGEVVELVSWIRRMRKEVLLDLVVVSSSVPSLDLGA